MANIAIINDVLAMRNYDSQLRKEKMAYSTMSCEENEIN